ncbi:MAG: ABC transporter transmembrane domain-containing protein [Bacteroidetes bacterium]|jgi:ABC-type multidrug transport system fused ATPase/permease subunit|nr:ATP-binding cassette domain-containing protein [Cryomorphaceae bacterium]MDA0363073.1 ABC transporter transmembrane domain-containing protein [Bacteroidota bacterium]MDA0827973.1 ABC transporter transmembrane domain-containing protein [Bacteroidota bacterium]MDA1198963.1 ABC transporter transmembrane domain-containing protein [Bacteroidota bacterium]
MYVYIRPFQGEFLLGMLFLLLSSGSNLAFPAFLGDLVDAAQNDAARINPIALTLGGLLLAQAVFSFGRIVFFERVAQRALAALRQAMYGHLIDLPLPFFHQRRVGELTSRLQSDIGVLQETFTSTLAEFIRQIVVITGGIALLTYTSWKLTAFMLAILPVVILLAVVFGGRIRKYSKQVQDASADSNTVVEESLSAIATVKAYTNEDRERSRYKESTLHVARLAITGGILRGAFASFLILGLFGALVAVVWKGTSLIATGELAAGQLFSFVIYSGFIGGSIGGMADVYARLQKAVGATEALLDMLDEAIEESSEAVPTTLPDPLPGTPAVSFQEVDFAYPSRPDVPVLQGFSLDIDPGMQVALVGPSGAGKTTVVQLLLRFHEAAEGSLAFYGHPSTSLAKKAWRAQTAWVPQDVILFGHSIRENIAYGRPDASDADIQQAAKEANAWEFIQRFPDGMDTQIGERGVQLSGGQRQRIAIARAVLRDPQILLLDEATSSLDAESEGLVQEALQRLMQGRTSLVIAHRLSTVRTADRIAFLDGGRVVEFGTHAELMALADGKYRHFVDQQMR